MNDLPVDNVIEKLIMSHAFFLHIKPQKQKDELFSTSKKNVVSGLKYLVISIPSS